MAIKKKKKEYCLPITVCLYINNIYYNIKFYTYLHLIVIILLRNCAYYYV